MYYLSKQTLIPEKAEEKINFILRESSVTGYHYSNGEYSLDIITPDKREYTITIHPKNEEE